MKKRSLLLYAFFLFAFVIGIRQYLITKPVQDTTNIYATTANQNDAYADAKFQQGTTKPLFPVNYGLHAEFEDGASETKKLVKQ